MNTNQCEILVNRIHTSEIGNFINENISNIVNKLVVIESVTTHKCMHGDTLPYPLPIVDVYSIMNVLYTTFRNYVFIESATAVNMPHVLHSIRAALHENIECAIIISRKKDIRLIHLADIYIEVCTEKNVANSKTITVKKSRCETLPLGVLV